jgi:hypothetical protein
MMGDRVIRVAIPQPRALSQDDLDGWLAAASQRTPPRDKDVRKLRGWLFGRNPKKYRKLVELMRWAEQEFAERHGLLPEDVRWLLP